MIKIEVYVEWVNILPALPKTCTHFLAKTGTLYISMPDQMCKKKKKEKKGGGVYGYMSTV